MVETALLAGCVVFGGTTLALVRQEVRRHYKRRPRSPIPKIPLDQWDPQFRLDTFDKVRQASVLMMSNHANCVPATPSDTESYIITALSKRARRMFEFGTCSGRTAYLWALNSPADAIVTTLTLPPSKTEMKFSTDMESLDVNHAVAESRFSNFVYSGSPQENKIRQLFLDSAELDVSPYRRQMDLIFIDGGHSYPYVENDSQKALEMVAPGGVIVWHDYRGKHPRETIGVYRYLNELSRTHPLWWIEGTSLVAYRHAG